MPDSTFRVPTSRRIVGGSFESLQRPYPPLGCDHFMAPSWYHWPFPRNYHNCTRGFRLVLGPE